MSSILISFISGMALSLAFPKANLFPVAWVAVSPLMYYTYRLPLKRAILCGLAFGMGFFASLLYWIGIFGAFPLIMLALIQTVFVLIFVLAARFTGARLGLWGRFLLLPSAWILVEWLRSFGVYGFPWGLLGYSQYKALPIIQIASLTGVWGISFLLAMSNAAIANLATAWRESRSVAWMQIGIVGVLAVGVYSFGVSSIRNFEPEGRTIRTAVIQGNVDQTGVRDSEHRRETWDAYREMTLEIGRAGADLLVWPEGVIPGNLNTDHWFRGRLTSLSAEANAHIIAGSMFHAGGDTLNAAYLISPRTRDMARYDKVHLVPFGEFVPARSYLPFLRRYRVTPMDISPGEEFNLLHADEYSIGTAICFESIFPYISRELTAMGAEALCVITNDTWFGRTAAAEQHKSKSVFRAIENDRYLLRAAATGISCIIDPRGRILGQVDLFERAYIMEEIDLRTGKTVFTRHGDWLVGISLTLLILLGASPYVRGKGKGERRKAKVESRKAQVERRKREAD